MFLLSVGLLIYASTRASAADPEVTNNGITTRFSCFVVSRSYEEATN